MDWNSIIVSGLSGALSAAIPSVGFIGDSIIDDVIDTAVGYLKDGEDFSLENIVNNSYNNFIFAGINKAACNKIEDVIKKIFIKGDNYSQWQGYFNKKIGVILEKKQ